VLAGLAPDATVKLIGFPRSSVRDHLRPRASSRPAAASLPDLAVGIAGAAVRGAVDRSARTLGATSVLWLGDSRF